MSESFYPGHRVRVNSSYDQGSTNLFREKATNSRGCIRSKANIDKLSKRV